MYPHQEGRFDWERGTEQVEEAAKEEQYVSKSASPLLMVEGEV